MDWSTVAVAAIGVVGTISGVIIAKILDRRDRLETYTREDVVAKARTDEWIWQQWWQRKADAYTGIIDSFWQLTQLYGEHLDYYFEDPLPKWLVSKNEADWAKLHFELKMNADVGAIVISEKASVAIGDYFRHTPLDLIEIDDMAFAERAHAASKNCLEIVKAEALRDLGIQ